MVDPNRKINRLTDKDIEFLDECEEEFANRYTEVDKDFVDHCSKPLADPPIVENWGFSGGQFNNRGGSSGYRNNSRGGWNRRGGGERSFGQSRNNYNRRGGNRPNPYENRGDRSDNRRRFNDDRRQDDDNRPPMNVRRDYGNFVAASKD